MPVAVQGMRGSGEFGVDFRPKNYRELYTLLEPNGSAPFNAMLAMGRSEATDDPEYKNFRDEMPIRVVTINNGAGYDATAASLTIDASDDNKFLVAGTILINSRTGEVMRVTTDVTATTLAVTRNVPSGTLTILDGDSLFVAGFAATEGSNVPTPISFDATVVSNYTQIFKTSFSVTNTLAATKLRTGPKLQETQTKALKFHMQDIERAFFWGKKAEVNGSSSQPLRYTGGLLTTLSNVIDCATHTVANQMTEEKFDEYLMSNIFKYGSKQKIAFVGDKVANHLQQMGKDRWTPQSVNGAYGVNLVKYTTFAGDLMIHLHPQFRDIPTMSTAMVIVDFPYVVYRHLQGRDTQLLKDVQTPGDDLVKHAYMTDCGLELLQDKVHTYIKNWATR